MNQGKGTRRELAGGDLHIHLEADWIFALLLQELKGVMTKVAAFARVGPYGTQQFNKN
jgi:hypothetical protein